MMRRLDLNSTPLLMASAGLGALCGLGAVVCALLGAWRWFGALTVLFVGLVLLAQLLYSKRVEAKITRVRQRVDYHGSRLPNYSSGSPSPVDNQTVVRGTQRKEYPTVASSWGKRVASHRKHRIPFTTEARRTHSYEMRDILVHSATGSRLNQEQLREMLDQVVTERDIERFSNAYHYDLNFDCLLATAQTFYLHRTRESDIRHSTLLYDIAAHRWGLSKIAAAHRSFYADGLARRGDLVRSRQLLSRPDRMAQRRISQLFLFENTSNYFVHGAKAVEPEAWLESVNQHLKTANMAPIALASGTADPFLRLRTDYTLPVCDGPMISVLMPVYKPDDSTDVAIASLLGQTWRNIELIIVDDGSPETDDGGDRTDYVERMKRWEQADARVRLNFNTPNRGAYTVRNIAYAQAQGEFVTVADKDDWHHPQRLQMQVEDLVRKGSVANIANWVRADESLQFLIRTSPDQVVHTSFPSMMFRRTVVQEKLGFWDEVRKGADTEYRRRLESVFFDGAPLVPFRPEPLLISLMGGDNLTAGDNALGYWSEGRRQYRASYRPWHRAILEGADPFLPQSAFPRTLDAPSTFLPEPCSAPHYDFVVVGDFSGSDGPESRLLRGELESLIASGASVAILPLYDFFSRPEEDTTPDVDQLVYEGKVKRVCFDTAATADTVLITRAALMQLRRDDGGSLAARKVVVVADRMPRARGEERVNFDPRRIELNVRDLFGVEPMWVAQTPNIWGILQHFLPDQSRLSSLLRSDIDKILGLDGDLRPETALRLHLPEKKLDARPQHGVE